MTTLILQHDDCLAHDPGANHPESSARLRAVLGALKNIAGTEILPAPLASQEQVLRVHGEEYWARVVAAEPTTGQVTLEDETLLSPGSINAALRGSGAACFAIDQIFAGKAKNAFCVTRPPGHHAEADLAMGFCLLNHVAVAARHALAVHPVQRVAIVDFDVHHGNGTQAIFEQSPEVFFASSHQMPLYPGTGYPEEVGCGNILNMPLQARSGGKEFRSAWTQLGLPALHAFAPDLILVSAGFDAHAGDPLGQLKLKDSDYAWITSAICDYAETACNGRVISVLEGGYNLEALAKAARAHTVALAQASVRAQ